MEKSITDKLRKLLALAESTNVHEAANAFARAQALATKHRIELASIDTSGDEDPMVQESIHLTGKRVMGWKKVLAGEIGRANGVYVINVSGAGEFRLAGRAGNVQTTQYLFSAVSAEIERLSNSHRGQGRRFVNAFKMGAAQVVGDRLNDQASEMIEHARASGVASSALVRVESARDDGEQHYRANLPKGRRITTGRAHTSSRAGTAAGEAAGQKINLGGNRAVGRGNLALGPA